MGCGCLGAGTDGQMLPVRKRSQEKIRLSAGQDNRISCLTRGRSLVQCGGDGVRNTCGEVVALRGIWRARWNWAASHA